MTKFSDVQKILDDAVGNETLFTHGRFWQTTRDEFVNFKIFDQCLIITEMNGKFVGPESPLVRILEASIECAGEDYPMMPLGLPAVDKDKIKTISDWIDAQCPE